MSLTFKPLSSGVEHLDLLFDDIEKVWNASGRAGDIRAQLEPKKSEARDGKMQGLIGFEKKQPIGFGWVELPHGRYGSILLHTLQVKHRKPLAETFVQSGLMDNTVLELNQFHSGDDYRQAFLKSGLMEKSRQKMGLRLEPPPPVQPLPPEVTLEPLKIGHASIVGDISYPAHQISKDLEGYPDFSSSKRRAKLDRSIFQGLFGSVIGPASLLLRYQENPVGTCLIVGLPGWGFKQVAWVLDMTIHPDFQGKGLGRMMFLHALKGAAEAGVPIAGLAVTKTNTPAIRLYEKIGFQEVEQFYEYVGPGGK